MVSLYLFTVYNYKFTWEAFAVAAPLFSSFHRPAALFVDRRVTRACRCTSPWSPAYCRRCSNACKNDKGVDVYSASLFNSSLERSGWHVLEGSHVYPWMEWAILQSITALLHFPSHRGRRLCWPGGGCKHRFSDILDFHRMFSLFLKFSYYLDNFVIVNYFH